MPENIRFENKHKIEKGEMFARPARRENRQSGVAAILALLVLSAILATALSVSGIMISELRLERTAGYSVPAFFAADAGIEKVLTDRNSPVSISETLLSNGATFWVEVAAGGAGTCAADTYCITSTGEFNGTRRAIEVNY